MTSMARAAIIVAKQGSIHLYFTSWDVSLMFVPGYSGDGEACTGQQTEGQVKEKTDDGEKPCSKCRKLL